MVTTTSSAAPATPWTTRVRQEMNALPRESRDMTVPIGTSSIVAISWYDRSSR